MLLVMADRGPTLTSAEPVMICTVYISLHEYHARIHIHTRTHKHMHNLNKICTIFAASKDNKE